jgi:hypothetical protein
MDLSQIPVIDNHCHPLVPAKAQLVIVRVLVEHIGT